MTFAEIEAFTRAVEPFRPFILLTLALLLLAVGFLAVKTVARKAKK